MEEDRLGLENMKREKTASVFFAWRMILVFFVAAATAAPGCDDHVILGVNPNLISPTPDESPSPSASPSESPEPSASSSPRISPSPTSSPVTSPNSSPPASVTILSLSDLTNNSEISQADENQEDQADLDSDDLINSDEADHGTLFQAPDSDNDGFSDGFEVDYGSNPLDPNSLASELLTYRRTPSQTHSLATTLDKDRDGLPDSFENDIGTDPEIADTDGDGVGDGIEIDTGSNPLTFGDANPVGIENDSDHDGLTDIFEELLNRNPRHPDSNKNGLLDGWDASGISYKFGGNLDKSWKFR